MSDLSTLRQEPAASAAHFMAPGIDTAGCLTVHALYAGLSVAWGKMVERLEPVTEDGDRKTELGHRRILEDPRAMQVLQVIWIESDHVPEKDLAQVGLVKNFKKAILTSHGMAVETCAGPGDLGRRHKQIQKVVKAAQYFGLVETIAHGTKKHALHGTAELHRVMTRLIRPSVRQLQTGSNAAGDTTEVSA